MKLNAFIKIVLTALIVGSTWIAENAAAICTALEVETAQQEAGNKVEMYDFAYEALDWGYIEYLTLNDILPGSISDKVSIANMQLMDINMRGTQAQKTAAQASYANLTGVGGYVSELNGHVNGSRTDYSVADIAYAEADDEFYREPGEPLGDLCVALYSYREARDKWYDAKVHIILGSASYYGVLWEVNVIADIYAGLPPGP